MTEREALMRSIIETPDDDTPRLVFADWLDENGEPERAAYVRAEVERARLDPWDDRHAELKEVADEIWHAHGTKWQDEERPSRGAARPDFRRGFLDEVEISTPSDLANVAAISPARRLYVPHLDDDDVNALVTMPALGQVTSMHLSCTNDRFTDGGLRALAESPRMAWLRELTLEALNITADGFADLLHSPHLARLTSLDIQGNRLDEQAVDLLIDSPLSPRLERLSLHAESIGAGGFDALVASPRLAGIRSLRTFVCDLRAESFRSLVRSPWRNLVDLDIGSDPVSPGLPDLTRAPCYPNLRRLRLSSCWFEGRGFREWLALGLPPRLWELDLSSNPLAAGDLRAWPTGGPALRSLSIWLREGSAEVLAAMPWLSSLRTLRVTDSQELAGGAGVLARSPHLIGLRSLSFRSSMLMGRELRSFAEAAAFPELRSLDLCWVGATRETLAGLGGGGRLPQLRWLDIGGNQFDVPEGDLPALSSSPLVALGASDCGLGDAGAKWLASVSFRCLKALHLRGNDITTDGARAMVDSPHLAGLSVLDLSGNAIPAEDIADLRRRFRGHLRV